MLQYKILLIAIGSLLLLPAKSQNGKLTDEKKTALTFDKWISPETKKYEGFINIYSKNNRFFFEINDTILNRSILTTSRIEQSSVGFDKMQNGYSGEELGDMSFMFLKSKDNKILITNDFQVEKSEDNSANGLKKALAENNIQGQLMSFEIKAQGIYGNSSIIDVTDFISGNSKFISGKFSTNKLMDNLSYINRVKSFPTNLIIEGLKTYNTGANDSTATVILSTSFLLLPKQPMKERYSDPRVGYFNGFYYDYDSNPYAGQMKLDILRWRLEPKPEDMEKYKRGELVEPIKPIIFYIDPATPKKWVKYLKQGVIDWQVAFERAGFKNAILAFDAPADSSWDMNDARFSVIVYKPSLMANAEGPTIIDPRSGEIVSSHIGWYHNVMSILHDWYLVQAGAVDKRAFQPELSTELMGELIRFVSSHEVGHTLGLKHNFGSSSTVPVEKLRNKKWVEEHGHTPSIMDYARFNYVAQPEDSITSKGIFPRIGDYDKWAIEFGYRLYPDIHTSKEEADKLFRIVSDSIQANPRLYYGEQDYFGIKDSRCQNEDLSDNVMIANTYGINNLKRIINNLPELSKAPTDQFGNETGNSLRKNFSAILNQLSIYHIHVMNMIGKAYYNKSSSETAEVFSLVPKEKQKQAMVYLNEQLFLNEPTWMIPEKIQDQVWNPAKGRLTELFAADMLRELLDPQKLSNLKSASLQYGDKTYTLSEFLYDLDLSIWKELKIGSSVSSYHRILQQKYVNQLMVIVENNPIGNPMVGELAFHLKEIKRQILSIRPLLKDKATKYHYNDILAQLNML